LTGPGGTLTLTEELPAGVSVATLFMGEDGEHHAVISRHTDVLGPVVSQYYGECEPTQ
jgi:hypothetical protein